MVGANVENASAAVLLVDDDPDVLESMGSFIRANLPGIRLVGAHNGPEGIAELRRARFDLIVSDYKMPGMDGVEFLRQAGRLAPKAGKIMITAYPDPQVAARAVQEGGASLLITKPFDPDYFIEVLRALLKLGPAASPKA